MVVDDQAMVAIEIEDILAQAGFEVVGVSSRANLEIALANGPYAVIVTDTDLAGHEEMKNWPAAKVVICSGKMRDELEAAYPGMPIVGKPFVAEDLLSLLPVR